MPLIILLVIFVVVAWSDAQIFPLRKLLATGSDSTILSGDIDRKSWFDHVAHLLRWNQKSPPPKRQASWMDYQAYDDRMKLARVPASRSTAAPCGFTEGRRIIYPVVIPPPCSLIMLADTLLACDDIGWVISMI
jgi:hypothetical protein